MRQEILTMIADCLS